MNSYKQFFLKQIVPILVTALISAIITALQTILTNYMNNTNPVDTITLSAGIGASLKAGHQAICKV
jgi:ABC-type enterobactin transport system permease subunit